MLGFMKRLGMAAAGGTAIPGGLTGTFDLRGTTLSGWVTAIPYATNAGVIVEVLRQGRVIANCETGADPGNARLPFSLDMDGIFTAAEIARETVTVGARSRRGDTGTLALVGTTQLELVRTHLGVPVETVFDLDFSKQGNARPYLGDGWSGAEEGFTWTLGTDSLVHFPSPTKAGAYLLRLTCAAFITPMAPTQKMDIFVNDEEIAAFSVNANVMDFHEFRVSDEPFTTAANTTLRLHHPYANSPAQHFNTKDNRLLAFSVRRLTLVRVLETDR